MKVCHIVSTFPKDEKDPQVPWLLELVRRQKARGMEVTVYAPSFKGLQNHSIGQISVKRFRYFLRRWEKLTHGESAPVKIRNPLYLILVPFYLLCGSLGMWRLCTKENFDVLHVHWPVPHAWFGYIGKLITKATLVSTFYGAELALAKRYPFIKNFVRWSARKSDKVIAISSFTKDEIMRLTHVQAEVIPYGAPLEVAEVFPGETSTKGPEIVLFVGRIIERKGLSYLIEAMSKVVAEIEAQLVIVGEGDRRAELERRVREKGLEETVMFAGQVSTDRLQELYQKCQVFVLPSIVDSRGDTEGLGVVLLEALTYKKPVVATDVGGIRDVIQNERTGLLVPQKDPGALSDAILRLLRDQELARRLGHEGHRYGQEYFSWDRILSQLESLYNSNTL
ncbi:MAG: N-acetyl-alpha-D-glucosaminyl L-malate synthase [Actinobacteria bacterium]|nr:N-acetyl-alpha-D-glucosaminyl L-malate synthase [Actinomycetota bacterium]